MVGFLTDGSVAVPVGPLFFGLTAPFVSHPIPTHFGAVSPQPMPMQVGPSSPQPKPTQFDVWSLRFLGAFAVGILGDGVCVVLDLAEGGCFLSGDTGEIPPFSDDGGAEGVSPLLGGGSLVTVKIELLDAFPPLGVLMEISPVVAPDGTVAEIELSAVTVNVDGIPWNFTTVVPEKCVPVIVTVVPTGPLVGVMFVTSGDSTVPLRRVTVRSYDPFAELSTARRI